MITIEDIKNNAAIRTYIEKEEEAQPQPEQEEVDEELVS